MAAAYKAKPRTMPVVFGAEIFCLDNCDKGVLKWYDIHNLKGGSEAIRSTLTKIYDRDDFLESPSSVFPNAGFVMGPAENIQALFQGMLDTGLPDDQLAAGAYIINNLDKIDINIEETLVRNKLKPRDKLPDEDGNGGPGFLHFSGMREPGQQAELVEKYKQYP
jgi:hypothetical protein